jgi:hypothetical protein
MLLLLKQENKAYGAGMASKGKMFITIELFAQKLRGGGTASTVLSQTYIIRKKRRKIR